MVNVHLHGPLAKEFGKVWRLDIAAPIEAVQAIAVTRPEIKDRILEMHRRGLVFRVRSKHHDYDNDDVGMQLGSIARIDIIPIVKGAGPGVRAVTGAILVYAGYLMLGTPLAPFAPAVMAMGATLILGAITEWLTPTPKRESIRNLQSWTMGGPSNTVDQGMPVPVIYGEVLTGGYPISGGVIASDVAPNGSIDASATIGGSFEHIANTGGPGSFTVSGRYSAGTLNLGEPFTYSWSYTGFEGAAAVRLTDTDKQTATLSADFVSELDFEGNPVDLDGVSTVIGTLTVTVTGKRQDGSGQWASATATASVTLGVNITPYWDPTSAT